MKTIIKNHYHWVIAVIVGLTMIACGGVGNSLAGITLIPITESLHISRGDYSTAILVKNISGIIINLFSGALFIKFGYRKLIPVCLALSALGYAITSSSQGLLVLCIGGALEGMYSLSTGAGAPRLIGSWFHRHYGLVMGIVTAMTGLGGSLLSIVFAKIVAASDWRAAYLTVTFLFVFVTLIVALFVRNKPEQMGLTPLGDVHEHKKAKREADDHWAGFAMEELKKKPAFYLLVVGTFLSVSCNYMALSVVAAHVQDCGMDAEFAATVQSLLMFSLAVVKLGFGFLSDKIGAKRMTLFSLVCGVVSMLLLAQITGPVSAYLAAVVYALALPLSGIAPPLLVASLFGYRASAKTVGILQAMVSAAGMVANPLTNYLRDALGSYRPVFRGTAVVSVAVVALYLLIFALATKDRKEYEKTHLAVTSEEESKV